MVASASLVSSGSSLPSWQPDATANEVITADVNLSNGGVFVDRIHTNAALFFEERGVRPTAHSLPVWEMSDSNRRILLVAHAGTNSVLIGHLLGLVTTPWEWERFVLGHASISRLVSHEMGDGHTFGLVKLSDVEHLDRADRTF